MSYYPCCGGKWERRKTVFVVLFSTAAGLFVLAAQMYDRIIQVLNIPEKNIRQNRCHFPKKASPLHCF
jgi:hypothetical protein